MKEDDGEKSELEEKGRRMGKGPEVQTNKAVVHPSSADTMSTPLPERKTTMGSVDFSALTDDLAKILTQSGASSGEIRNMASQLKGSQAKRTRTALRAHAMEIVRDAYRRSWNLLYTRECLAHMPNLGLWGKYALVCRRCHSCFAL